MNAFRKFVSQNEDRILGELNDLLRIPSISTAPEHAADCRKAADWLVEHLKGLGCPKVKLLGSDNHPVVWGEGPKAKGKPTVLVYGHYDVQPPDPVDLWETPPFEPTVRDGNLYARGTADDKGQVFAIIKAFEAVRKSAPVNVHFLLEGQEESGSEVLIDVLKEHPELLEADAVLVADMPYYAPGIPAAITGLRGLCYVEIKVETLKGDLHSGLYGGVAPNAHETLVHLLARLKSPSGRINVPGLYEAVDPPSRDELAGWKKLPFNEGKFRRAEVGSKELTGIRNKSVLQRLWALPTLEIHGIAGGFTAEGAKTVIPAEATAKVSLRLVPKQKPKTVARQLKAALKELAPSYAKVTVNVIHTADPVLVKIDSQPFEILNEAFREVEGRDLVPIRSGGSIPIVPELGKGGAPVLLAGIGLPDDGLHAPNEKINLNQFWKGITIYARFFELMGSKS